MAAVTRRQFINMTATGALCSLLTPPFINLAWAAPSAPIKAIAFDAFPIFDPRPIFSLTKTIFPDKGDALGKLWFNKIFAYSWLRTAGDQYRPFDEIVKDALIFATNDLTIELTDDNQTPLLGIWKKLQAWPDVRPALEQLRAKGVRLGFLSNMTEEMLRTNAQNAAIDDLFDVYLSTDSVQRYKPHPDAYQMGVQAFDMPKDNIAFAAFAGWDAAGAGWFGYPTIWLNRLQAKPEELGIAPAIIAENMSDLANFVTNDGRLPPT